MAAGWCSGRIQPESAGDGGPGGAEIPRIGAKAVRMVVFAVVTLAGAYLVAAALLYLCQRRLLYFPTRTIAATPDLWGLAYEEVWLRTSDGLKLNAWFVPAENPRAYLILCHGNAGNICHRIESLEIFHRLGLATLVFDYRGYGRSEGRPDEEGTYRDAEAAWDHLVGERGVEPERIVVFGRSLGGPVAARLAMEKTPGALILESTFTSGPDVAARLLPIFPARWLCRMKYPTAEFLRGVRCPVLVAHSPEDELIAWRFGLGVFEAAGEPKEFLEISGTHNEGFLTSGRTYVDGLDAFLRRRLVGGTEGR